MTKQEYCEIKKKLLNVELAIKDQAIQGRRGRAETALMVLAGKIAALDFLMKSKKEQDIIKKDLDNC